MKRKLAAILSADVVGYSRLMGKDEESTIRTLTKYRSAMTSLIQQHQGRVVDAPGDNILAEFASAVHAVTGAVEIQRELAKRNAELFVDACPYWSLKEVAEGGQIEIVLSCQINARETSQWSKKSISARPLRA